MPYSIVRPTIVFGNEDILVNNMAWLMRKFPIFPIFGSGQYTVQPVYVGDLAPIAVAGAHDSAAGLFDVIGPETFTFKDFVKQIASQIQPSVKLVHVSPRLGIVLGQVIGLAVHDIVLTRDELEGLMDGLLASDQAPNGTTRFSAWLESNRERVGTAYTSGLGKHYR